MTTLASIEVIGNIGEIQPRRSTGPQGKPYLRINVAVDEKESGEKKTTWYVCVVSGKAVETPDRLLKVFKVGRKIRVVGKPRLKAYKKGDGSPGASITVLVDGLPQVLDSKPEDD